MKSLVEQMYVYASYHRDRRNKRFHFVGVPLITFAILVPMAWLRVPLPGVAFEPSAALAFVLAVLLYYVALDVALALGMVMVIAPLLAAAEVLARSTSMATAGIVFGVVFVGGWIVQLVGHHYEGRRPALVDNLFQVFVAPMFLLAEVFFALGWKKDVEAQVEALIAERGLYGLGEQTGAGGRVSGA